ncbi:unnamed protein product [Caenorhabditis angaria]|uniref:DNA2/NAM7 helicase-like C-terminal domain-containing protein n=1 Tax=Caenorhabditis angaria TaxID=860376 RepID=A0A9P1N5R3_9PELO|nr:unnamed protein product [Caenorhabditis angaria]
MIETDDVIERIKRFNISLDHPWQEFYKCNDLEVVTDSRQTIFTFVTLENIQKFRQCSEDRDCFGQDDGVFALYSVTSKKDNGFECRPIFYEIVADDRPDLQIVHIEEQNNSKIFIGDVIKVTGMLKFSNKWYVFHSTIMERNIANSKILTPFTTFEGGFNCVTKSIDEVIELYPKMTPEGTKIDTILEGDIFIPIAQPGHYLGSLIQKHRDEIVQRTLKVPKLGKLPIFVFRASKASDGIIEMFEKNNNVFKYNTREKGYEKLQEVVEHGSSGIYTIKKDQVDENIYKTKIDKIYIESSSAIVTFSISNEASMEKWDRAVKIRILTKEREFQADVMTAQKTSKIKIKAKMSSFNRSLSKNVSITVIQRDEITPRRMAYSDIEENSKADKLIQSIYGGQLLEHQDIPEIYPIRINDFVLLETQTKYAQLMANEKTIAVIGSSSFGCGKTATIAATTIYLTEKQPDKFHVISAVTNCAVVAVIEKLKSMKPDVEIIRLISKNNMKEIQPELLTDCDFPKMMADYFMKIVKIEDEREFQKNIDDKLLKQIIYFLREQKLLQITDLNSIRLTRLFETSSNCSYSRLVSFYLDRETPKIIVGTVDSVINSFSRTMKRYSSRVSTLQIDEASMLSRENLIQIAVCLQKCTYSFVGDHRQLAPFCERTASPLLLETAVGNFLEEFKDILPSVFFNGVFRCRPEITNILGRLFYNSSLKSLHRISKTEEKLKTIPMLQKYPILFVNTEQTSHSQNGTSLKNTKEAQMAMNLVDQLLKYIDKSEIAIICFYRGQLNEFYEWSKKSEVYVGSVDSSQGREWDICIICTTRTTSFESSDFMIDDKRINVALSRCRHLDFIFGNKQSMINAKNWNTILVECSSYGTLVEPRDFNSLVKEYSISE